MGSTYIEGFKGMVDEDARLSIHLSGNFYPPIHPDFKVPAKAAIEHVNNRQGQTPITMPNGVTKTAFQIVEGLHLDSFIHDDLYYDDQ